MRSQPDGIPLVCGEEVAAALHDGAPVVALESNVITHGLRYPDNIAAGRKVEAAVRAGGAVPATTGVLDGQIVAGMTDADMERFASQPGIPKVSSRDLPVILATGGTGATTIASSLVVAELAGIRFLASAGIGGVHRGAQTTMDISSDLIQFTRSQVAVVCAGGKSILDLRLTMEYLETQCVPIVAYRSDDFPAFYCISSGVRSPHRLDDEAVIARAIEHHWLLGNRGSFLITSPIRAEDAVDETEAERVIAKAMAAAARDRVTGNKLTKYLLRAVDDATNGRSAAANASVLISNAELGGRLAAAYARHRAAPPAHEEPSVPAGAPALAGDR